MQFRIWLMTCLCVGLNINYISRGMLEIAEPEEEENLFRIAA